MFFSFLNTFASFQSYTNKIVAVKLNVFVIVNLNNILIYTKNIGKSHIKTI